MHQIINGPLPEEKMVTGLLAIRFQGKSYQGQFIPATNHATLAIGGGGGDAGGGGVWSGGWVGNLSTSHYKTGDEIAKSQSQFMENKHLFDKLAATCNAQVSSWITVPN